MMVSVVRDIGDETTSAIVGLLRSSGAEELRHGAGRTLLEHLLGTYSIVRRWGQPLWLQRAALIHSVYGTDSYRESLLAASARSEVAAVAGDRAERLAYLFCMTPRGPLLAGTHRWARRLPLRSGPDRAEAVDPATPDELDSLVLLHMANLADQARGSDGGPGRWLVRIRALAELLGDTEAVTPPPFIALTAGLSAAQESLAHRAYRDAVGRADDPEARASRFGLAAAVCPVAPEPCVWLAFVSRLRGDAVASRSWAAHARGRLNQLGTAWDKRLTFEEWRALIDALERPPQGHPARAPEGLVHPRALFDAVTPGTGTARAITGFSGGKPPTIKAPDAAAGRERFQRYVESLAGCDGPGGRAVYPDLPSTPWHEPAEFPLVQYLESNYPTIRNELLALGTAQFQPESESIRRAGDWDVAFLYERGRRHDEVCALCPVTTRGVDAHPAIRTTPGLIYVSRMRPATHIEPHRGPTNLRVRCHLAIKVPQGDCAIRVGEETRQWREGSCLVFDDHFEHEAWNNTEEDRAVLIVDLWHPGLSPTEVTLLEGLHDYTHAYARRLSRYWAKNAGPSARAGSGSVAPAALSQHN